MKWIDDVRIGKDRRKNVVSIVEMEATKRGKGYIKAIGPSHIEELTPKQKQDLNLPTNRTLRDNSNSLGLSWQFRNEITRMGVLIEIREYGDNYLKSPSAYNGDIDKVYEFFKDRFFLVVKFDEKNRPYLFSDLVRIGDIPKKRFYFSESRGNKNRVNIEGFNQYFTLYKLGEKKKGLLNRPDVIDQLDALLT